MKSLVGINKAERAQVDKLGVALENAEKAATWLAACQTARNEAINELRLLGWTIVEISELTGLSKSFIHKTNTEAGIVSARTAEKLGHA